MPVILSEIEEKRKTMKSQTGTLHTVFLQEDINVPNKSGFMFFSGLSRALFLGEHGRKEFWNFFALPLICSA